MKILNIIPLAALLAATTVSAQDQEMLTNYVNTTIGTGGHGHVFMGANVPFGMVQLGPTSIPQSWDWCSGYHDSDSTVIGFSHTHLEGTGIGDLFDVTLMPVMGEVTYARGTEDKPGSGLWSYAERSKQVSTPGYYSVPLVRDGILAELTATNRVGVHRYTFPKGKDAAIVIDLQNGGCWDKTTQTEIKAIGKNRIEGFRYSKGWANNQRVYFVAEFSRPFKSFELNGPDKMYGRVNFGKTKEGEQILVKVAISPVSIAGAAANLKAEMPGWDFDGTVDKASQEWNRELERIKIKTDNQNDLTKFYTAMYHSMIVPATFSDVDGSYRGADDKVYNNPDMTAYTIYSLWDTYRAAMPLMSIINEDRNKDMINNMVAICDEQGVLPVWHLWANETNCMVGNPGIIPVADAIVKNQPGIDREKAYKSLLKTAADTARGGKWRAEYGYIPSDKMVESIAFDMEYAIADGAIARAASVMGDTANVRKFTERSHSYRNYFDPSTGFVRGKMSDGSFRTPFDPNSANHRADDYCEGNAWQYTWLVPQDLDGLVQLFGSREEALKKLDLLFNTSSELRGKDVSPDISGLIGQYAHGNEPSHHTIYFYTMLGEPDKTADLLRQVYEEFYTVNTDGLAGNEDAGQMSAWYILSTLGFYQVEPASGRYWFGSPLFDEAVLEVPGGKFTVKAINNSPENKYIRKVTLNGKPYDKMFIMHDDIRNGGELVFEMGSKK